MRDLVARLQRRLGTRCRVVPANATSGRIEIDYASLAELDAVLERIGA